MADTANFLAVIVAVLSVVCSTLGLTALRCSRPSQVSAGTHDIYVYRLLGVFGALLLYGGLALSAIPWILGFWNDSAGQLSAIIGCTSVLSCWIAEAQLGAVQRGSKIHPLHAVGCALVWFSTTLIEWAGPKPHDSMMTGTHAQIAGCDGGYRSPFLIYAPLWLTAITFGSLLLLCLRDDCGGGDIAIADLSDEEDNMTASTDSLMKYRRPNRVSGNSTLRRQLLPLVYGFTVSMGCLVLASGADLNIMGSIFFGAGLLVIAVLCAWEWLWALELPLVLWALLSQNCLTLLRLVQRHMVFRDFRWNADTEYGPMVVWKYPGVFFYLLGFFLTVVVLVLYLPPPDKDDDLPTNGKLEDDEESDGERTDDASMRAVQLMQCGLFASSVVLFYFGVTRTVMEFQYGLPSVQFLQGDAVAAALHNVTAEDQKTSEDHMASGKAYVDLITMLYEKRLPCSAMVLAFNTVVRGPMQFITFVIIITRPSFVPIRLAQRLQTAYIKDQAAGWFCNVFVLMLLTSLLNLTGPRGIISFTTLLGSGFWFFLLFSLASVLLAISYEVFPESGAFRGVQAAVRRQRRAEKLAKQAKDKLEDSQIDSEESDDDDCCGPASACALVLTGLGSVALVVLICVSMYFALTKPFLDFTYRGSGIVLKAAAPTGLELLRSIGDLYPLLWAGTALTLGGMLVLWVPLFFINLPQAMAGRLSPSSVFYALEHVIRPWVMIDLWAVSLLVLYYIFTARNKGTVEVCVKFPDDPTGILAVVILFASAKGLIQIAKSVHDKQDPKPIGGKYIGLTQIRIPGGKVTWGVAAGLYFAFWLLYFYFHAPQRPRELQRLQDVNDMLTVLTMTGNENIHERLPFSAGNCEAFWQHKVEQGEVSYANIAARAEFDKTCHGHKALAKVKKKSIQGEASWATGLNTLKIGSAKVIPPDDVSRDIQEWRLVLNGTFTDLHVWLKIYLHGKPFVNDYMCCHNPFHFALEARANCTKGIGFSGVTTDVIYIDPIEFQHTVVLQDLPGLESSYDV
eukprot:TRINITY_DN17855_c0_g1_i3.p1 TRINITY_DN17855_c0_g1~~TRINITY_DN17855_c0_g1_i3.p1  ORF type:complete len:1020 (-),score=169.29 TRINITY_DN17855_c0_g1_i3:353-3412(-)